MKYLMSIQFSLKIFGFGWWTSPTGAHDCITRFFCTAKSFYSLNNVFCFRASNVYEDKCKVLTEHVQTDATLLDVTCCVRLHTLLHVVGNGWAKSWKPVKLLATCKGTQQLPTLLAVAWLEKTELDFLFQFPIRLHPGHRKRYISTVV